ncbi:protein LYK5 [Aristolochia californica]|uniref:protein LYK5 n=1 Tax=Aristolochia californica TaxID=171875 RepID=UPI0035D80613
MAAFPFSSALCFLFFCYLFHPLYAQQDFINNEQFACYINYTSAWGYTCNGPQKSCTSYLIFRSQPPSYDSAVSIAYLLNSRASDIAQLNQISDVDKIPANTQVLVPVNCSCSGNLYQHNSSYTLKSPRETYFSVANNTYQGLSTCQALMNQNVYGDGNMSVGLNLVVPLRCACPTRNQITDGVKYLVTYLIDWGNDIPTISQKFQVDEQSVRDANNLSSSATIFPFNSLLIPLKSEPTRDLTLISPPSAESPEPPFVPTGVSNSSKSNKGVYIGIGIGAGCLLLLLLLGFLFWFSRRGRVQEKPIPEGKNLEQAVGLTGFSSKQSPLFSAEGLREVVDSLPIYKFEELQRATGFFGDDHLIQGSVYRGVINGDDAAIKRMKGDVSNEINILKRINHSNVIRLSGFCSHEGNSYLVYEFAENGSLSNWLHERNSSPCLTWKQRVQVAYDVADGLHYLHNYANPPYVHKNLKSSNILLDGCFRAKIANFGLAKGVENEEGYQMTRHVVGTQGYMALEYLEHGLVTPKLDVFAFGVVMLELLSGREAASSSGDGKKVAVLLSESMKFVLEGENVRKKLKDFIDPNLRSDYPLDLAFTMAQLALNCVASDLNSRPTMNEVFLSLSKIFSSSLDWDSSDASKSNSHIDGR